MSELEENFEEVENIWGQLTEGYSDYDLREYLEKLEEFSYNVQSEIRSVKTMIAEGN